MLRAQSTRHIAGDVVLPWMPNAPSGSAQLLAEMRV